MPYTIVTIIHILACFFLVLVVLLQTGKGADMGAVFGGSSQTIFGSQGAGDFLTKTTTGIAVLFMFTSLFLSYGASRQQTESLFDSVAPVSAPAPAEGGSVPEADTSEAGQEGGEGTATNEPQATAPTTTEEPKTASPAAGQAVSAAETEEATPGASIVPDPLSSAPAESSGK